MSRFTDDLYRHWLHRNGSAGPRKAPSGGMGGVPPMATSAPAPAPGYSRARTSANDETPSRPVKQIEDYVDKSKKDAPPLFLVRNEDYYPGSEG